ncbi:Adenylosuccinate synthetase [Maioricimonas rarisocia]|uniref:Adenylosuccinate synthetase n=1 Tax=Maioricimonas rarisocia TaxID=2528026 RepID=A0A517Z283_9PLAN|nr:adenylosuccinate synthase [Maioricimonas rarisocia]QDU36586.1 Adenylosuccinate synthetase [Maioricimonas rarisocia]
MAVTAVVGLQWGDEAKGKIVDLLTDQHEIVVRYLGGNNAGHTVVCNGQTYKLSLLPSGILRENVVSVIATGVVINPQALLQELDSLSRQGVEPGKLLISDRAHVIFPYHLAEEAALERHRGAKAIGTTMRGIGTCYRDKAGRTHAIRMGDMMRPALFRERLEDVVAQKNVILKALDPDHVPLEAGAIYEEYTQYIERLGPMVTDTTAFLHRELKRNASMLFEAAQGSLLDIDHGTFPYVTSSNSSGCGIHPGSGVPERVIEKMIGVVKAYTTRVGGGACPTELEDETGQHIRDEGNEYGTVTGRPRRCGWFDAVATGYGARISGVDCLAVMLLDVLSKLDEVKICEAYEIDGERTTDFPSHIDELAKAKPVYRTLPGWKKDITGARKLSDLPSEARAYIDCVGELVGAPVEIVSVGPDREQTVRG